MNVFDGVCCLTMLVAIVLAFNSHDVSAQFLVLGLSMLFIFWYVATWVRK